MPTLAAGWWVSGIRAAQSVVNLAIVCDLRGHRPDRGRLGVDVIRASEAIVNAAKRLSIPLTDYMVGLQRVHDAGVTLEDRLGDAQSRGLLKEFNRAYAARRRLAVSAHVPFISYP